MNFLIISKIQKSMDFFLVTEYKLTNDHAKFSQCPLWVPIHLFTEVVPLVLWIYFDLLCEYNFRMNNFIDRRNFAAYAIHTQYIRWMNISKFWIYKIMTDTDTTENRGYRTRHFIVQIFTIHCTRFSCFD